jgi:hypothetical protein
MRRALLAAFACLSMSCAYAGPGDQTNPTFVKPGFSTPVGYCQATVGTSAQPFTGLCFGGAPKGATYALICNEGTAVRWRDDGIAPSASVGQILGVGTVTAPICAGFSTDLSAVQFISESASTFLDVSFYK